MAETTAEDLLGNKQSHVMKLPWVSVFSKVYVMQVHALFPFMFLAYGLIK